MAVEPNGSMEGAFWVILQDHNKARKFYSSHDSEEDAKELADAKNKEAEDERRQLLADAQALEDKTKSTPDDKHRARCKKREAECLSCYSVRSKPNFVQAKLMGADGKPSDVLATRMVPKQRMGQAFGAQVQSEPVMVQVPVMIPDPNWVNEE